MKLFTTKQIADLDKYTIANEPISDIDLMERASLQISNWLVQNFPSDQRLVFFAGPGNNGGDALAIARQMAEFDFSCVVFLLDMGKDLKGSPAINWQRLVEQNKDELHKLCPGQHFPTLTDDDIILDGLFGSGVNRALNGFPAEIVRELNKQSNIIIAIDMPSGLMGEDNTQNNTEHIVRADYTLSFQMPKISFLFAENDVYVGDWQVLPIGLHRTGMEQMVSPYTLIDEEVIVPILPQRAKFDHKGNFGHALLVAGSYGKMGAAVLAAKACMRAGVGLLTSHVPRLGYNIIQTTVPESMVSIDQHDSIFTEFPNLEIFSAIGVGPGLDKKSNTQKAFNELLSQAEVPLLLDADAINILAENKNCLNALPEGSILTPHPGEFKRLLGESDNSFQILEKQIAFSKKYKCVMVLKGAHTSISTPNGHVYFNTSGNPGMATAGSGDALTGIILGMLAQGMNSEEAAILGVFLHGLAGDLAADDKTEQCLIAGDIIEYLPKAFAHCYAIGLATY